jgi:hypothetical protein
MKMANKLPTTSFGRLARQLKKTPMTRKEITQFLLEKRGDEYRPANSFAGNGDHYNSSLYGTRARRGFLETVGKKLKNGKWTVRANANLDGPFTPYR